MSAQINILDEITVDGFCGGGGWSTGMELALGEPVTIGINHDAAAIAMHKKNHPNTKHYNENIYAVDPYEAVGGRKVGWAHFSPDCTHFSVAKGGTPVKKNIRGLAWVVTKWAGTVKPRIISMENVKEFITWGPLIAKRDKETGCVLKLDGLVTAFIEKAFGGGYTGAGSNVDNPIPTITSKDHNRLVTAFIERQYGTSTGHKVDEPLATVTGVNKSRLVEVFLQKYNGGSNIIEIKGEKYQIVDICMRMLTPRELYLAQGFPKDYVIEWEYNGKAYPKTQQVAKVGNSVPPPFATALVRANWPERCVKPINTMSELNELIYEVI